MSVTTEHLDYLQRAAAVLTTPTDGTTVAAAGDGLRRLRLAAVGRAVSPGEGRDSNRQSSFKEVLTGLHGCGSPVAWSVTSNSAQLAFDMAVWTSRANNANVVDRRRDVAESLVRACFARVVLDRTPPAEDPGLWPVGGCVLGVPSPLADGGGGEVPLDRVLRALTGLRWQCRVLAVPVNEVDIARLRDGVVNELRETQSAAKDLGVPDPLSEEYTAQLRRVLRSYGDGLASGGWRVGAYILGDEAVYPLVAAAWRAAFATSRSYEPVRVHRLDVVPALARDCALLDQAGELGPGRYRRLFEYQTLMSSTELGTYVSLPRQEAPGLRIFSCPTFDTAPATGVPIDGRAVTIGTVALANKEAGATLAVPVDALTRHTLICGVTGSGKTNTLFHILKQLSGAGVNFLVIEPAKREYRELTASADVRVLTVGDETCAPLRLNPFQVPVGYAVRQHIDLLRSVFAVSMGMWTPLPQVLERCLNEIYVDRGWDLATDTNARVTDGDRTASFPTLAELAAKVDAVVPSLGYEARVQGDIRAALLTRLESLRGGTKGRMLDVQESMGLSELFTRNTILELEGLSDDDDKAFVMALISAALIEHLRAGGPDPALRHVLVIEEAHRLLGAPKRQGDVEEADPRGKAVDTFVNMLAEIRAYGEGIVIADQSPNRLAAEAVKSTDLKIAHRVVAEDDRLALAGAMAMDRALCDALTTLEQGEAAVFREGEDRPMLVVVPPAKGDTAPADEVLRTAWLEEFGGPDSPWTRPTRDCVEECIASPNLCAEARRLAEDALVQQTVSRLALTIAEDARSLERMVPEVLEAMRSRRLRTVDESLLLPSFRAHAAAVYVYRRGARAGWPYTACTSLARALAATLAGAGSEACRFAELYRSLHVRESDPYPGCSRVCGPAPGSCLYRLDAQAIVATGWLQDAFEDAEQADTADGTRERTFEVATDGAYYMLEFAQSDWPEADRQTRDAATTRAALCFAQHMLGSDDRRMALTTRRVIDQLLNVAGLEEGERQSGERNHRES